MIYRSYDNWSSGGFSLDIRFGVFLGQSKVLTDSAFDLDLHLWLHFSPSISSIAVDNEHVHNDKWENYNHDDTSSNTIIFFRGQVVRGYSIQVGETELRRVSETSTDGVKHRKWLELTSVGPIIDDNSREDTASILPPVVDFLVDNGVISVSATPVTIGEGVLNTLLSLLPVHE